MAASGGHLVLVVGPSGAGKDSVLTGAKECFRGDANFVFPRRFVTRLSNPDAEDHISMTEMEFALAVADGAFSLWWRAHGNSYGIGRFVESHLDSGAIVAVNCSRASVGDACGRFANVTVAEVTAPDEVLVNRIVARGRETAVQARERLARKVPDYPPGVRVVTINNDGNVGTAVAAFCGLLRSLRGGEGAPAGKRDAGLKAS